MPCLPVAYYVCMTQDEREASAAPTRVVAERVKWLRTRRGWSGADLATEMQDLGVKWSQSIVANLESGRRPDVTVVELFALAYAFSVSPLALLFPSEPAIYAVTPDRSVDVPRMYDWVTGYLRLPLDKTEVDSPRQYPPIPAGLPEYLVTREQVRAVEGGGDLLDLHATQKRYEDATHEVAALIKSLKEQQAKIRSEEEVDGEGADPASNAG